ncbi:MAG: tetratricopeptide repeat protein, partial [Sulfuricaulis sp.]
MSGFTVDTNARLARAALATATLSLLCLLYGAPVLAELSESSFPTIQMDSNADPMQHAIASDQVALMQYNSGHQTKAVQLWQTLAEHGDADAQFTLGVLYNRGDGGVEKDMIEAVRWYRKAAEQGHVIAQYNMGIFYATGTGV